jgi:hypothetical protein
MVRSTTRASGDGLGALGLGGALDQLDPPGGIGHLLLRESVAITESRTIPTNQLLSGRTLKRAIGKYQFDSMLLTIIVSYC